MLVVVSNFRKAMDNYALPQGDIALFMNEYAECRSNLRGIIGYDDQENVKNLLGKHEARKGKTYQRLEDFGSTMVTPEGHASYKKIQEALEAYFEVEAEIIELGSSTDSAKRAKAQDMAFSDLAPAYEHLDAVTLELMDVNIQKEKEMSTICNILEYSAIALMIILTISIILISRAVSNAIANSIAKPLGALGNRMVEFENGDISSPFPNYHEQDEVGDMINVVSGTTAKLQKIFEDLESLLNEMANGNFNIKTACEEEYVGEYKGLLLAIRMMNRKMDEALKDVKGASEMVAAGSTNLAEAAQLLAEGCASAAESSQSEMKSMVSTKERISETSNMIESIIGEIEDIASQKNLLSLNAAIEAARAGDAGKGFAVVADQIRSLAEQSVKAAVNTRELIEGSVSEIDAGSKAALKTAEVLESVVNSVKDIAISSKELSENIKLEVESIEQANEGINRISEVVQNNSATAEEASATSEELSAQAISLDELVSMFKLRE